MSKKLKVWLTAASVAFFATAIAVLAVQNLGFLSHLETIAGDIRVAALSKPMPQSKDIVIAAIDESTLTQFPYRSPVDRAYLADLIQTLEAKGPRAIGVDVLFDGPTESSKDDILKKVIRETKVPLFLSYSNSPNVVDEDQLAYLNDFDPPNVRAGANLARDPNDDSVRWIYAGETGGMPMGFVRKALSFVGIKTPAKQVEIAWRPGQDAETPPFAIYPSQTVALLPDEWFKDKIVLVGAVLSITDRHRTPLAIIDSGDAGNMPGILVMAHGISQFLEQRSVSRSSLAISAAITFIFALSGLGLGFLKQGPVIKFSAGGLIIASYWAGALLGYTYGIPLIPVVTPTLALALALWLTDVLVGRAERKQRQFIQGAFSRYVSPAVVSQLANDPSSLSITGVRREVTFIFTDITGFTTLSEGLTSEKLSEVLNDYLNGACAIILKYEGTIDKFIGDAIMSIFNAPISQADHAERAVKCALELDAYAEAFRIAQNAEGVPIGVTRIGIHTGTATVGNFGSQSRMDFTALGDTVNTAARTEGVNKYFGTRICATEETVAQCVSVAFRKVGNVVLKGKTKPVGLFSPVSEAEFASGVVPAYEAALAQFDANSGDAPAAFARLQEAYPDDALIAYQLKRVASGTVSSLILLDDK